MTIRSCTLVITLPALLLLAGCGGLGGLWGNDEMERYAQRLDTITDSAGNAKEVNRVTHTIDPWPPGVGDRRIVADGERMQRAVERYRRPARPPDPLPKIGIGGEPIGTAGGGGGAAAAAAGPAQRPLNRALIRANVSEVPGLEPGAVIGY